MPKQPKAMPGEVNGKPIDSFTITHLAWGVAMGALGLPWWAALGSAFAWDLLVEPPLKNARPEWFPVATQDTVEHIITDAAAWMIGWGMTKTWRDTYARTNCPEI